MVHGVIPLNSLQRGQSAMIDRVSGRADHVHRLEEFGLRGGVMVEMFRSGNPCIIRMAGSKVCFRSDSLVEVLVQPTERLA